MPVDSVQRKGIPMQHTPRSVSARAQSVICVLAVTVGLTVAPSLVASASAEQSRSAAVSACASAQAAQQQAKRAQAAAKAKVVKAQKAVAKAKKARKPAVVKKAKKALTKARTTYAAATRAYQNRGAQVRSACAKPAVAPAINAGKKISLLGLGEGLDLDQISLTQLTALLENLLPGVTDNLDAGQLASLLAGFNAGTDLDPADALSVLNGVLPVGDITALLGGTASPEALTALIEDVIDQLSGLAGNLPIPGGFDPTGLWETFSGIFGNLDPDQLGSLLALVTSAFGGGSSFDLGQLTDLIDSLVPGISESFDPDQLTSMLSGLNGEGLSAATLSNLLGGQFSPAQLQQVIDGTAGQVLLGTVVAQVMAQLSTAGLGGLELPGPLGGDPLTSLLSTVTDLVSTITSGLGVLPVVCGLIPIPLLCP